MVKRIFMASVFGELDRDCFWSLIESLLQTDIHANRQKVHNHLQADPFISDEETFLCFCIAPKLLTAGWQKHEVRPNCKTNGKKKLLCRRLDVQIIQLTLKRRLNLYVRW